MTEKTVVLFERSEFTTVPSCPEMKAHEDNRKAAEPVMPVMKILCSKRTRKIGKTR
jgi:hypothetical protein